MSENVKAVICFQEEPYILQKLFQETLNLSEEGQVELNTEGSASTIFIPKLIKHVSQGEHNYRN